MAYSSITKSGLHFNTKLYTGDGATSTAGTLARTISGVGFQPDFTWVKGRTSGTYDSHGLHDVVRTAPKWLRSDGTDQEYDVRTGFGSGGIGSFTSDGFGIFSGSSGNSNNYNTNNTNYVAMNWKAGGTGSSNTDGAITSTVSANTTAGFSIVTYTGTGSTSTVGHGLGVKPEIVIYKERNTGNSWRVMHDIGGTFKRIYLNTTAAEASIIDSSTAPTSTVLNIGTGSEVNRDSNATYVAYCFASKKGFSKFGRYTGNGNADGPFIYLGFKPAFVIIKQVNTTNHWYMWDNKRSKNVIDHYSRPNTDDSEGTYEWLDFVSNGIKIRNTSGGASTNGGTYVYMAWAAEPLVANVGASIPATAR